MLEPQVIASKKGSKPHTDLDFSLSHKSQVGAQLQILEPSCAADGPDMLCCGHDGS